MARVNVANDVSGGIIRDMLPEDLPPEVWSDGLNMRFAGKAGKIVPGMQEMFEMLDEPPNFIMPVQTPTEYYWVVGTSTKIYAFANGVLTDISRDTLAYKPVPLRWRGGVFNGTPFFNNQLDYPQIWGPGGPTTKLVDLPNWPEEWYVKNMSTYKSFMVGIAPTEIGQTYDRDVMWSAAAGPGEVPVTWDQADPTHEAGEQPLADTNGVLLDQLVLGDSNILYKDDSVYSMTYVGGQSIFKFRKLFNVGMLTSGCVALFSYQGDKHAYLSQNNLYVHDGVNNLPILTDSWQQDLFSRMEQSSLSSCFVTTNSSLNEVWVCFPEAGQTRCTAALVYNYQKSSFSFRQLPGVLWGDEGIVPLGGAITSDTWDTDTDVWDHDSNRWSQPNYRPAEKHLVLACPYNNNVLGTGFGLDMDGVTVNSYLERVGLTIVGQDRKGFPIYDTDTRKQVNEVWPRAKGNRGTTIYVNVGSQETSDDDITWDPNGPHPFVIGTDRKVDCFAEGRILAVRFEATVQEDWQIHGYDFDLVKTGRY